MRTNLILLGLLALSLLAGCPSTKEGTDSQGNLQGKAAVSGKPQVGTAEQAPVAASESGEAPTSAAPPAEQMDAIPQDGELTGKWFSLFAQQFKIQHLYTSVEGHTLDFGKDGYVTWALRGMSRAGVGMRTPYRVEGDAIILTYSESELTHNSALAATPLGFGRDKEVGLDSAGRDKEIGLVDKGASPSGDTQKEIRLTMVSDGYYLALSDEFGNVSVYGRDRNPGKANLQGLPGKWAGHAAPNEQFGADFSIAGDEVSAKLDNGKTFKGRIVEGYVVGELTASDSVNVAAILPVDAHTLNGMFMENPGWTPQLHFDFMR